MAFFTFQVEVPNQFPKASPKGHFVECVSAKPWKRKPKNIYPGIPTTIKTIGVNITTMVYLRVLIIEIGSTIILMVVEAQGIIIPFLPLSWFSGRWLKESVGGTHSPLPCRIA